MKLSQEEMTRFLPQGLYTEGAYLYSIVEEETGTQAGYIWFNVNRGRQGKEAFIYDFYIFEPYQRNGYGSGALALLDDEARSMGVTQIGLHVFGDNERALKLYQKWDTGLPIFRCLRSCSKIKYHNSMKDSAGVFLLHRG